MKVILDFDYTLLDTEKFKKALAAEIGVSWEDFVRTYNESMVDGNYNIDIQLSKLGLDDDVTRGRIKDFLKNIDDYLHEGSYELVKGFVDRGDDVVILSKGEKELQRHKIENSRISKLCRAIIADEDKALVLDKMKTYFKDEHILIINDNSDEAAKMKKVLVGAETYITAGPYADPEKNQKIYNIKELTDKFFPAAADAHLKRMSEFKLH